MAEDLVRMVGISKSYGPVQALTDVDFTVREREIVGHTSVSRLVAAFQP